MADPQFCLLAIDHWSTCMTKGEWSGWMQAVGSVLAIAAGVAGLSYQAAQQKKMLRTQKIREELEVVAEHRELLEEALAIVVEAEIHASRDDVYREYLRHPTKTDRFQHTAQLLSRIQPEGMPSAALKVSFSQAQQCMQRAAEIREFGCGWAHGQYSAEVTSHKREFNALVAGLLDAVNRFDHHLLVLRQFGGLADFDTVDELKFLSRAERSRLKA